jgi:hypothetical protein
MAKTNTRQPTVDCGDNHSAPAAIRRLTSEITAHDRNGVRTTKGCLSDSEAGIIAAEHTRLRFAQRRRLQVMRPRRPAVPAAEPPFRASAD